MLADEIRAIREELEVQTDTLQQGRARSPRRGRSRSSRERILRQRRRQLGVSSTSARGSRAAAAQKRAEQEAALNAALDAKGDVEAQIEENEARAFRGRRRHSNAGCRAERAALEEARRLAELEARREPRRNRSSFVSRRLPLAGGRARVTQEWGPTSFTLEPPYTYQGAYYPHFHGGHRLDRWLRGADPGRRAGVVVASGQPLWP